MAEYYNTISEIVATSTIFSIIILIITKKMIDNIGHIFCQLGTLLNLRVQCERVLLMKLLSLHSSCAKA